MRTVPALGVVAVATAISLCLGSLLNAGDSAAPPGVSGPAKNRTAVRVPTSQPTLKTRFGDVAIFAPDNPWNQDISKLPVHPQSADFIRSIGEAKSLHPDFGTVYNGAPNGIPYVVVSGDQKKVPVEFEYADESDRGTPPPFEKPVEKNIGWYPIPPEAPIEGGPNAPLDSDRHILVIDVTNKLLYETWSTKKADKGRAVWKAGSGAIFDLTSDGTKLRPQGWTSADAAGLPVFPGLVRYDEVVENKAIRHAIRFTVKKTQRGYIRPATHFASRSSDAKLPPMGLRVRLRADFDDSKAPACAKVIVQALKTYGMILADNGGDWFLSGAPDPRWNDDEINWLKHVKGSDFECVDTGPITKG